MKICYIVLDNENKKMNFISKILIKFKKLEIKQMEDMEYLINIPVLVEKFENIKSKKTKKYCIEINNLLNKNGIRNVALNKVLNDNVLFKNLLYTNNVNILDGSKLHKVMLFQILEYILEKQEDKLERQEVSIMINNKTELSEFYMIELAQKIKNLNIITNQIEKFKSMEEYIYENFGMVVRVSKSAKKTLNNSNIIINFDYTEQQVNNSNIPLECIIVNLDKKIIIKTKKFNGIIINDVDLKIPLKLEEYYKRKLAHNDFEKNILIETKILNNNMQEIISYLEQNNITVNELIGNNNYINKLEFKRVFDSMVRGKNRKKNNILDKSNKLS